MALLPPLFLDAVVAIGIGDDPADRAWVGTGFLFGQFDKQIDPSTKTYSVFLVTNKHVLKDLRAIYLKFNSAADTTSKDYHVPLFAKNGKPIWAGHPDADVDVAVLPVNANLLKDELRKYAFFQSDAHVFASGRLRSEGVTEGDGVFVLGFPMGMVAAERQYVICRVGAIARIRDFLDNKAKDFLLDATVFPGNSGGPVILKPEVAAIANTKATGQAALIGVVKSYVPYREIASSRQTRAARIVFEENSGLTSVEPMDYVLETVQLAMKRIKWRLALAKWKAKRKEKPAANPALDTNAPQAELAVRRST